MTKPTHAGGGRESLYQKLSDDAIQSIERLLQDDHAEELSKLWQGFPGDKSDIWLDYSDIVVRCGDLADIISGYVDKWGYEDVEKTIASVVRDIAPAACTPRPERDDISVRVYNLNDSMVHRPSDLRSEHSGEYIGVKGVLDRVTTPAEKPLEGAFECQRCGTLTYIPQSGSEFQEPHECSGCDRNGPFQINETHSEWTDYCKLRVETPPDESGDIGDEKFVGYAEGDLVDYGHDAGILGRVGEACTVYGTVERQQKQGRNANELLFDRVLRVQAIEFDNDEDTIDVEAHREEFEELAERPDAVDLFAESLVPELYATPAWEHGLELAVAYLFAAPRIDVPQGPSYRGDIHAFIVSGYGMGKSMVNSALAAYSPDVIKKSATALSSDVGLLAAAVKDDFGEGQWTIKPGILVRGNGGHVILDEIDKTGAELSRMNDALEGDQRVDVEKAGQSVTYQSRVGLWATGNPAEGRFNAHDPVAEQLDVKPSLLSRFDGIVTMKDVADEELDADIAGSVGDAYVESQEYQFGGREEFDKLERPVAVDVGRAWVKEARENCHPLLQQRHVDDIKSWYAEDVRQLNEKFATNEGVGHDMPVPVNPRVVEGTIRFSVAFARCHLREQVADVDVERAKSLMKALVGQTFDEEDGQFAPREVKASRSQRDRVTSVESIIEDLEGEYDEGAPVDVVFERAGEVGIRESKVEHEVDKLKQKGELYSPSTGRLRTT